MVNLIAIDTDQQLHDVWPRVRAGLEVILTRSRDNWIPEDVYAALKSKGSILVIGQHDGAFVGFVVLTMNKGFDGLEGHIWAAYNISKSEYIHDAWPQIQGLCRASGCRRITMSSTRKGWAKLGEKLGLEPVQTLYAKDI